MPRGSGIINRRSRYQRDRALARTVGHASSVTKLANGNTEEHENTMTSAIWLNHHITKPGIVGLLALGVLTGAGLPGIALARADQRQPPRQCLRRCCQWQMV